MSPFQLSLRTLTVMSVLLLATGASSTDSQDSCQDDACQSKGSALLQAGFKRKPTSGASSPDSRDSCQDDTCQSERGSALLQAFFKRKPEAAVLKEARSPKEASVSMATSASGATLRAPCQGVEAQGKCWHLSDPGESCSTTCAKYGEAFSFVVANNTMPITPSLLGSSPHIRQQPWAALECNVQGQDRYLLANVNAAKNFVGDIGAWSHSQCQLACPCTLDPTDAVQCTWKPPKTCAHVFEWKGVLRTGCTTVGHDKPWCMNSFQPTDEELATQTYWSECEQVCSTDSDGDSKDKRCEWKLDSGCAREFDYEGTRYVGCTSADHATPWCSLTDKYAGAWAHCQYSCPFDSDMVHQVMKTVMADDELCSWHMQPKCSNSTEYNGVTYSGCIDVDYPTPWCSYDSVHNGKFSVCRRSCNQATLTSDAVSVVSDAPSEAKPAQDAAKGESDVAPEAAPNADTPTEGPCVRDPDSDIDIVGNYVSLDEAGYSALASVDSFDNMKRFVCRAADKIHCTVMNNTGLAEFVPRYSSVSAHQDYAHLESELEALCHSADKWLVPTLE